MTRMPRDVVVITILILASFASFGLGYVAGLGAGQGNDVMIGEIDLPSPEAAAGTAGQVVASKNGTKYYLPSCAGADKISDANKVWFVSVSAATVAGYAPAANCKGL